MKRNIIIDYLNIPSVLKLIMYERGSNVKALFRPQSKKLESTLIKIIQLFDINYSVDKMTFSNPRLSRSIANELFKRTGEIAKSISDDYMTSSQSKLAAISTSVKISGFLSLYGDKFQSLYMLEK